MGEHDAEVIIKVVLGSFRQFGPTLLGTAATPVNAGKPAQAISPRRDPIFVARVVGNTVDSVSLMNFGDSWQPSQQLIEGFGAFPRHSAAQEFRL